MKEARYRELIVIIKRNENLWNNRLHKRDTPKYFRWKNV